MAPTTPPKRSVNKTNGKVPFRKHYGKYDTHSITNQLWLAKLPSKLAAVFEDAPEGKLLGHLTFTKGTPLPKKQSHQQRNRNQPSSNPKHIQQKLAIQISTDLVTEEQSDLPLDYTLTNLTTKIPVLHPFTRAEYGQIALHGTISKSCNLQMERTERYRNMCKSRLIHAVTGGVGAQQRIVKPVQNAAELVKSNYVGSIGTGFGSTIAAYGQKILDAKIERDNYMVAGGQKRKFDETRSVRSILFTLFEHKTHWSAKELIANSGGRSEKAVRAELKLIAQSIRTGEHKGLWELKSDYDDGTKVDNENLAA
mmetsp:Transcript_19195/g.22196  ORF Transcript_19195/g.22196 Transcript_19195/m.22196 type:complete len:310 (-) Transcript_19195:147-1076(-)